MKTDSATPFLTLSDHTLSGLGISTLEIVETIESALGSRAEGNTWTAPKSALLPGDGRYMMTTLAASDAPGIAAVKYVMVSPRNPERGLKSIEGSIILHDSETGELLAVMQAGWITGVRTAGLSAVAARRLANPESKTIAFVGAGQQARSHLQAFSDLFPLTEVRVLGRGQANIDRLSAMARELGFEAQACATPREALEGADLVVSSVTLAFDLEPFLDARWLKPGAFAAITDAAVPWERQSMAAFDKVFIDDLEQERGSANSMVELDLVKGDLQSLMAGTAVGSFEPETRSAFVFRGMAIGDFAVASLAYSQARANGLGEEVSW